MRYAVWSRHYWTCRSDYSARCYICCRCRWTDRRMVQGLAYKLITAPLGAFLRMGYTNVPHNLKNRLKRLKMDALEHFRDLFGHMELSEDDAARWVFVSGWNSALSDMMERVNRMPLEKDTRASFNVYLHNMMVIDPSQLK